MSAESSFPLVTLTDADEIEGVLQVQDCEDTTSLNAVKQIVEEWEWVAILLGDGVEATVVDAEPQLTRFLSDKEDGLGSG